MSLPTPRAVLNGFLLFFLAAGIWILLAPTQLGGQVSYVIIDGNSMEPGFYFGDLGVSGGMLLQDRIYPYLTIDAAINLVVTSFIITLLS